MKKEIKEKKGKKLVGKFIDGLVDFIEKKKSKYIQEMVACMIIQADIILRARKDGIEIKEIMPEIKKEYEKQIKILCPTIKK